MSTSITPKFVPTTEELSTVERDLRFHPCTTEHPRCSRVSRFRLLIAMDISLELAYLMTDEHF